MSYFQKYLKYKNKYLELKNQLGGDLFYVGDRVVGSGENLELNDIRISMWLYHIKDLRGKIIKIDDNRDSVGYPILTVEFDDGRIIKDSSFKFTNELEWYIEYKKKLKDVYAYNLAYGLTILKVKELYDIKKTHNKPTELIYEAAEETVMNFEKERPDLFPKVNSASDAVTALNSAIESANSARLAVIAADKVVKEATSAKEIADKSNRDKEAANKLKI